MSLLKYFIAMSFVFLLLSGCTTLEVGVERRPGSQLPAPTPTIKVSQGGRAVVVTDLAERATVEAHLTITPSPTPTPDPRVYVGIPRPGTLYLGYIGETPTLFFRPPKNYIADDPNAGMVLPAHQIDIPVGESLNFQKLSRPRVVLTNESSFDLVDSAQDLWKRFLYVSYITECIPPRQDTPSACNQLMEINLDTLTTRGLWLHNLFSDVYPGFQGPVVIDQVVNPPEEAMGPKEEGGEHFLILRLLPCYGCEPYPPHAMLVLNVGTGQEMYLGKVGNVNIDFIEKAVSYQNLGMQRVKCDPNPLCEADGYMTLYAPTGELLKQPLP